MWIIIYIVLIELKYIAASGVFSYYGNWRRPTGSTGRIATTPQWRSQDFEVGGNMASAEREPIWGFRGGAPVESRGRARGKVAKPPEAGDILYFN